MGGGHPVEDVWPKAAAIAAQCHGVPVEWITAPTRGRGARPPAEAWEAKQHAIAACVAVAGCSYAELGRLLGMHRDTVAHHCAAVRDSDAASEASEDMCRTLQRSVCHSRPIPERTAERRRAEGRQRELTAARNPSDDRHSSDKTADHENVIAPILTDAA